MLSSKVLVSRYQNASTKNIIQGKYWYPQACLQCIKLAQKYSFSSDAVIGVVAALSPRLRWENNISDAELTIRSYLNHQPYNSFAARAYKRNIKKAYDILAEGVSDNSFGQKTSSFYHCIKESNTTSDVCIDVWAARALGHSDARIKKSDYQKMQNMYREAADILNVRPHELQATVWLDIREND